MQTLYDVLGLSRLTTQQQIDLAYNQNIESLTSENNSASIEQNAIRAKAIKEAYSILSSPPRRQSYDASLRAKEQVAVCSLTGINCGCVHAGRLPFKSCCDDRPSMFAKWLRLANLAPHSLLVITRFICNVCRVDGKFTGGSGAGA